MKPYVLFPYCYERSVYQSFMIGEWYGVPFFEDFDLAPSFSKDHPVFPGQKKVVLVDWSNFENVLNNPEYSDFSWADLVISATTEQVSSAFFNSIRSDQIVFNNPNTIHLINGYDIIDPDNLPSVLKNDRVHLSWPYFFATVVSANDPVDYTDDIMKSRLFLFEALVGSKKSPRSYIYYRLRDSCLLDRSLVNLSSNAPPNNTNSFFESLEVLEPWGRIVPDDYRSPALEISVNGVSVLDPQLDNTVHTSEKANVNYKKINPVPTESLDYAARISEIIPTKIYQHSWFSLICETNLSFHTKFITEKTVKMFFGKRIFVFFGPHKHLEYIKSLGFKTFEGIIDEGYDQIFDHSRRFDTAWKQVLHLAKSDPAKIYQQAKPILEHNFRLANNINALLTPSYNFIQSHLEKLQD